jgi:hypothetical protein
MDVLGLVGTSFETLFYGRSFGGRRDFVLKGRLAPVHLKCVGVVFWHEEARGVVESTCYAMRRFFLTKNAWNIRNWSARIKFLTSLLRNLIFASSNAKTYESQRFSCSRATQHVALWAAVISSFQLSIKVGVGATSSPSDPRA